jgi:L,D-transpeptidase catalytic domain/Putative peptidoglycan binding domain
MRRNISVLKRAFFCLFAVAAAFGVAAPDAARPPAVIASGVSVGGIGVGGLTSEPARTRIRRAFGRPLEFMHEGERWETRPSRFATRWFVPAAVTRALEARPGQSIELGVSFRPRLVQRYVAELGERFYEEPVDARLDGLAANGRPIITPEHPGRRVAKGLLQGSIAQALHTPRRAPMRLPMKPVAAEVTQADFGAVVVIARESKKLTLYDGQTAVRSFRIATGQASYPTPLGEFSIATKQRNPWWYPPPDSDWAQGAEPIPPGPGNPLGTRWMGLTAPLVGIHGTPDAASIGYSASHGCIRMLIPEADWLFDQVEVGTPVVIVAA